jgi:acyl-CoA synthetase (AMP-forming)/AMP-acid ligase II
VSSIQSLNLADILSEHRRRWVDRTAAVDEDGKVRLTYPALDDRATRLANALLIAGVAEGGRVMWLGQNSFRLLELILAAAKTGAIVCPANWRLSPEELAFAIGDCDPAVVVWQEEEIGERARAARVLALGSALWLRHDPDGDGNSEYEAFLAAGAESEMDRQIDPASPLMMIYTAAFGGRPAGALITHTAIIAQSLVYGPARGITHDYRYLAVGPLFHVATLIDMFATFVMGGCNVFLPRNDPAEICRVIDAERITGAFVIGPAMEQLAQANQDRRYDLSSLVALPGSDSWNSLVTVDASPWGRKPYGFGQTETLGYATYSLLAMQGVGGMGHSSPVVRVRILDEPGQEVPNGEVGEIALRGLTVSPGYWNRPELTFQRQGQGWHRTNDLGRRERDGSISFVGPKGQLIKSAAENVYPAEVEACIRLHSAVKDVGVIGTPDPVWVQHVKAIVVLKPGHTATEAEIIEHCRARIASYKKPRIVVFAPEIPRAGFAIDYDRLNAEHGGGGYPGKGIASACSVALGLRS